MAEYVDVSEIEEVSPNIFPAGFVDGWNTLVRIIKDGDKADVAPVVHARWIGVRDGCGICSNCNRQDGIDPLATHCRYCGAKMDLEE